MAKLIIECNPCDVGGPYGTTSYYCGECGHNCKKRVYKCPKCDVVFDEESEFKTHRGFGGHDFI